MQEICKHLVQRGELKRRIVYLLTDVFTSAEKRPRLVESWCFLLVKTSDSRIRFIKRIARENGDANRATDRGRPGSAGILPACLPEHER
jgi:hypothetical protein